MICPKCSGDWPESHFAVYNVPQDSCRKCRARERVRVCRQRNSDIRMGIPVQALRVRAKARVSHAERICPKCNLAWPVRHFRVFNEPKQVCRTCRAQECTQEFWRRKSGIGYPAPVRKQRGDTK